MYKNNSRDRSKSKDCSLLQLSSILTSLKPAIGYYSYTNGRRLRPLGKIRYDEYATYTQYIKLNKEEENESRRIKRLWKINW